MRPISRALHNKSRFTLSLSALSAIARRLFLPPTSAALENSHAPLCSAQLAVVFKHRTASPESQAHLSLLFQEHYTMKALFILVLSINNVNFVLGRTLAAALASASAATASPVNDLVAAEEPPTARISLRRLLRRRVSPSDHFIRLGTIAGSALPARNWVFVHIPKTGGDSFQHDAQKFLPLGSTLVGNDETSFAETPGKVGDMVVLMRKPESHVLSQFMQCAHSPNWGMPTVREYESSHPSEAQFPHTGVNPSPVYGGFVEWLHHFESSSIAWGCYNPRDLQATRSQINSEHAPFPPHSTLTERLESLGAVLITEHYLASVCLFEYRAVGFLTPHCACTARSELKRSSHHDAHGVPKHSINDIDEKTLELIRSMTRDDAELYAAALARFKAEVHEVFAATGVDLLCEEEERKGSSETKIEVAADVREAEQILGKVLP